MTQAPSIKEALKPCPFCGGDAESDSQRHYRNISTGNLEKSAAIYCTKCNADMTWCYRDTPEIEREQVMVLLTEQWNARATFQPDGERREAIARILADPKHQERARYVQGFLYGDAHVIRDVALRENQELFRTKDEHEYEQRLEIEKSKFAAGAILASGLVQDEAAIPDGYALVPIKPTMEMLQAGADSNPTDWNDGTDPDFAIDVASDVYTAMVRAAIRSARNGGAET